MTSLTNLTKYVNNNNLLEIFQKYNVMELFKVIPWISFTVILNTKTSLERKPQNNIFGEHRCNNPQIQYTIHVLTLQMRFISRIYGYYMICKSNNVCNTLTTDKKHEIISTDK